MLNKADTSEERLNSILANATEIGERMIASMFGKNHAKKAKQASEDKGNKRRGKSYDEDNIEMEEDEPEVFFAGQPRLIMGTMKV